MSLSNGCSSLMLQNIIDVYTLGWFSVSLVLVHSRERGRITNGEKNAKTPIILGV